MSRVAYLLHAARHLSREERAQDAFEYVLVVGGVTVAVILTVATPVGTSLIGAVLSGTCDAVGLVVPAPGC